MSFGKQEYLGGAVNEWHIHNIGNGHIKLGNTKIYFEKNQPVVNWKRCEEAMIILRNLTKQPPNYDKLVAAIKKLQDDFEKPQIGGTKRGDIERWTEEAQVEAQKIIKSKEWQKFLKENKEW